jgi:hypothetical protein
MYNCTKQDYPGHFLIAAIAIAGDAAKEITDPVVEIEFRINGIEMSFVEVMEDLWKRANDHLEQDAREKAIEMITEVGLNPISEVLLDAEYQIRQALPA